MEREGGRSGCNGQSELAESIWSWTPSCRVKGDEGEKTREKETARVLCALSLRTVCMRPGRMNHHETQTRRGQLGGGGVLLCCALRSADTRRQVVPGGQYSTDTSLLPVLVLVVAVDTKPKRASWQVGPSPTRPKPCSCPVPVSDQVLPARAPTSLLAC